MRTFEPTPVRSLPRPVGSYRPWALPLPEGTQKLLSLLLPSTGIEFVSAIEWACPEGWRLRARRIPDDMWFCVLAGEYACRLPAMPQEVLLGPGGLFLIPRGEEHDIRRVTGACRMAAVHFQARCSGGVSLCALAKLGGTFAARGAPFAQISRRLCREQALRAPGWREAGAAGVWQALLHRLREFPLPEADSAQQRAPDLLLRAFPALERIERDLADPELTAGELAACAEVSEVSLRKWFHALFGKSPVAYLQARRVAHACHLLLRGEMPVKEIAGECGFRELSFFYRVFQRETGLAPAAYRRRSPP